MSDYRSADPGICRKHTTQDQNTLEYTHTPDPFCFQCFMIETRRVVDGLTSQLEAANKRLQKAEFEITLIDNMSRVKEDSVA